MCGWNVCFFDGDFLFIKYLLFIYLEDEIFFFYFFGVNDLVYVSGEMGC